MPIALLNLEVNGLTRFLTGRAPKEEVSGSASPPSACRCGRDPASSPGLFIWKTADTIADSPTAAVAAFRRVLAVFPPVTGAVVFHREEAQALPVDKARAVCRPADTTRLAGKTGFLSSMHP